jgi:predicted RNA binding protein YcfA (HicA-like mRNA interferase family)
MSILPLLTADQLIKILQKIGFKKVRQQESHVFLKHLDGWTTIVPNHPGEKIDRGLLNKIIKKDLGLTRDEFLEHK